MSQWGGKSALAVSLLAGSETRMESQRIRQPWLEGWASCDSAVPWRTKTALTKMRVL